MTKGEVLRAAAIASGFCVDTYLHADGGLYISRDGKMYDYYSENDLLFDIEFARGFFTQESTGTDPNWNGPVWKHHMANLAVSDDRISYIKQYL